MTSLNDVNEQLLAHNCVRSICVEFDGQAMQYNLVLVMADSESLGAKEIRCFFYDVASLNIEKLGGGLTQFMHLKISKIDYGFDRAKYELTDEEGRGIYFTFLSMSKS